MIKAEKIFSLRRSLFKMRWLTIFPRSSFGNRVTASVGRTQKSKSLRSVRPSFIHARLRGTFFNQVESYFKHSRLIFLVALTVAMTPKASHHDIYFCATERFRVRRPISPSSLRRRDLDLFPLSSWALISTTRRLLRMDLEAPPPPEVEAAGSGGGK